MAVLEAASGLQPLPEPREEQQRSWRGGSKYGYGREVSEQDSLYVYNFLLKKKAGLKHGAEERMVYQEGL